jgi:hypothetical protein
MERVGVGKKQGKAGLDSLAPIGWMDSRHVMNEMGYAMWNNPFGSLTSSVCPKENLNQVMRRRGQ